MLCVCMLCTRALLVLLASLPVDRVQYSHVVELLPPGAGPLDVVSTANLGGILAQLYNANPRREDTKQAKAMCMNFILMTFHW